MNTQIIDASTAKHYTTTESLLALLNPEVAHEEFAYAWLQVQYANLHKAESAVLLFQDEKNNRVFKAEAKWPLNADVAQLAEIAYGVIDEKCGLLVPIEKLGHVACAYPIFIDAALVGIVAVQLDSQDKSELDHAMQQLQWSTAWFNLRRQKLLSRQLLAEDHVSKKALAFLTGIQEQANYLAACQYLVSSLATELACSRVSIAFPENDTVEIIALSHSGKFSKRMALLASLQRAMEEALVKGSDLRFPEVDSALEAPDHEALRNLSGVEHICSVPIYLGDQYQAVLCFESAVPLTEEQLSFVRAVGVLSASSLKDKYQNQQALWKIAGTRLTKQFEKLVGPKHALTKLVVALVVLTVIFFGFAKGEYRIGADTVLEGEIQRVLAAPFSGYIREAPVKVGDEVKSGQVIYQLNDDELRLERKRWLSEKAKYRFQFDEAYAAKKSAEMNVNRAQMEQADAQLALIDNKLQRSKALAPFEGLIISGDLSQRIGDYVEQGEVLFELAPLNRYRIILLVDDARINDVKIGQHGALIMHSLPGERFEFTVKRITPETEAKEGANYFRVEAVLEEDNESVQKLRPGMQGVGKISVDRRRLIGIWTRSFREWLFLLLWRWQ